MKNKLILKIPALILASFMAFSHCASAYEFSGTVKTKTNDEYARECAAIVSEYSEKSGASSPDSFGKSLRILGRTSDMNYSFKSYSASECVFGADGRFLLQFKNNERFESALKKLRSDDKIIYAELDSVISTSAETVDDTANISWGVSALALDKYDEKLASDSSLKATTVAVVDTGIADIDPLKGRVIEGYDFIGNDTDARQDVSGDSHGTFLAGMIADSTKTANVNIMPVRVIESKTGYVSNTVNGIRFAADNGADVINVSLSGTLADCDSLEDAVDYAESKDVTVVVCAGNFRKDTKSICPAHVESAITVSAVDESLEFASAFSDFGETVDVCAPGVNIQSYGANGELKILRGTSMSAAYISAGAALCRMQYPELTSAQIQTAIKNACTDLGEEGFDIYYGYGLPQFINVTDSGIEEEIINVNGISLDKKEVFCEIGESFELVPTVTPENATNSFYVWNISDEAVVKRTDGNNFKCISEGTATVTVKTVDGGFEASVKVTVKKPYAEPVLAGVSLKCPPDKIAYTYKIDNEIDLSGIELELVYSDGTKEIIDDVSKMTASGLDSGKVGEQNITVKYQSYSFDYSIKVEYAWWQWIIRILLLGFIWY